MRFCRFCQFCRSMFMPRLRPTPSHRLGRHMIGFARANAILPCPAPGPGVSFLLTNGAACRRGIAMDRTAECFAGSHGNGGTLMKRDARQRSVRNGTSGMTDEPRSAADLEVLSIEEQKSLILSILTTFLEDEKRGNLTSFVRHVGFDVRVVRTSRDFFPAWLGHYRLKHGLYDV